MGATPALAAGQWPGAAVPAQEGVVQVVVPNGDEVDALVLMNTVGEGFWTAAGGVYMAADGMTRMVRSAQRGDWWGFTLGAAEYLIGKATTVIGVVTGPATP